jgi:hypothetical protein
VTRWSWAALPFAAGLALIAFPPWGLIGPGPHERAAGDALALDADAIERGRQLYREGRLSDGRPLEAIAQRDVVLSGAEAACIRCHQRSGFGASEGPVRAPPIVPSALPARVPATGLGTAEPPQAEPARVEGLEARLAAALLHGAGGDGHALEPSMPRYRLAAAEVRDLAAYLASIDVAASPGVTPSELRLATLVSDAVPAAERDAFIATLEAYVKAKNGGSRLEEARAAHAPWPERNEYTAYRKWSLDVWELSGPADTWGDQFRRSYERRPVFAVVSGLANDSFEPVAGACEALAVPCLFPITPLAGPRDPGFYTFHFSRGVVLDAELIARELCELSPPVAEVVQVYADTPASRAAAAALRAALERPPARCAEVPRLRELRWDASTPPIADRLEPAERPRAVVVWLGATALEVELAAAAGTDGATPWLASTRLAGVSPAWFAERCRQRDCSVVHPFDDAAEARDLRRFGAWARSRGLAVTAPRVQLEAFFALLQLGEAVMHVRRHLVREFVLETIEHAAYRSLVTAGLPRLNLAPGQRFASLGASVIRIAPGGEVTRRWRVP